jgi:iron complex transport system ATP-binding protein
MPPNLKLENMSFDFKDKKVLRGVSFEAEAGTVTAIIGPNAAGKSTLLRCMMGILRPLGTVLFDDRPASEFTRLEWARHVGYLPQERDAETLLSVFEAVLFGRMRPHTLKIPLEDLNATWKTLEEMNLGEIAARRLQHLSGGQRKLVSIAQILVREPKILLLDEPTANLDLRNQLEIAELIRERTRQRGMTTILTLHDLNVAARFADQVVVLKEGRVCRLGTPREVFTARVMKNAYNVDVELLQDSHATPVIVPVNSSLGLKSIKYGGNFQ